MAANNGKARKTGAVKTVTEDGVVTATVRYSMLNPPPAGTQTPNGWAPVPASTLKAWTTAQYQSAYGQFLGLLGVVEPQRGQLVAAGEYDEAACLYVIPTVFFETPLGTDVGGSMLDVTWVVGTFDPVQQDVTVEAYLEDDTGAVTAHAILIPLGESQASVTLRYNRGQAPVTRYATGFVPNAAKYTIGSPSNTSYQIPATGGM